MSLQNSGTVTIVIGCGNVLLVFAPTNVSLKLLSNKPFFIEKLY
jgi:hypothetical protein